MIEKFIKVNVKNKERLLEYIDFCQSNNQDEGEEHHILPKDLFPEYKNLNENPWNKSTLSIINHIKAHILLCEAVDEKSMFYARNMMIFTRNHETLSEADFSEIEKIKIESRKMQSKLMKENNPMQNEETKAIALAGRKKYFENGGKAPMQDKKHSEETKAKMSKAHKGKVVADKSKSNLKGYVLRYGELEGTKKYKEDNIKKSVTLETQIAKYGLVEGIEKWEEIIKRKSESAKGEKNSFFGKTHSEETRKHLSERAKNRVKMECPHCGKEATPGMAKRWHFDNCKLKG